MLNTRDTVETGNEQRRTPLHLGLATLQATLAPDQGPRPMPRRPIPTWCFAVVVVQRGHQFLLVHERKHGGGWYVPAGRVEPGESFAQAAVRETMEETGVPVRIDGLIRVEHSPMPDGNARMRVIFHAVPVDDTPPRDVPNDDTLGAAWFTIQEANELHLRGNEVLGMLRYAADGRSMTRVSMLTVEGAPW